MTVSTPRRYFEEIYAVDADPWGFATNAYECRKYDLTIAALPRQRYVSAFEPGCSIGVLSERLAKRCDHLLVTDIIPSALAQAETRLRMRDNVDARILSVPEEWPPGCFDLVVLSEIGYYFDEQGLDAVLQRFLDTAAPNAHLVAVHWRGQTDYPQSGDQVHERIGRQSRLRTLKQHVEDEFRLDVWELQI